MEDRSRLVHATQREVQVIRLLMTGKAMKAIATELKISRGTLRRHIENMSGKLAQPDGRRLETRALIVQWAYCYPAVLSGCAVPAALHAPNCSCGAPYCAAQATRDTRQREAA